jgi:hypothetical protein
MPGFDGALVPQADDLSKVFELAHAVSKGAVTDYQIGEYFDMTDRQGRYYRAAAVSVGLVTNYRNRAELTAIGQEYVTAEADAADILLRRCVVSNPVIRRVLELFRDSGGWERASLLHFVRTETETFGSTEGRRVSSISNWMKATGFAHEQGQSLIPNTALIDEYLGAPPGPSLREPGSGQSGEREAPGPSIPDAEFDPSSVEDAREKTLRRINLRRGQPAFRNTLLQAYEGRCAVTGFDVANALEAAHIVPYQGEETNHPGNGLLLRADIHVLFDVNLIAVDTDSWTVVIAPRLQGTTYEYLAGQPLHLPDEPGLRPSVAALDEHRHAAGF